MGVMDNTIAIDGYRGLYLKNTMGLKLKKLTKKDYSKINNEKVLHFVMQATSPERIRRNLKPVKLIGIEVKKAIIQADDERTSIIESLKNGEPIGEVSGVITIEDLWNEFTTERLRAQTISQNYVKNNTSFFNKHLRTAFMPHKTRTEKVKLTLKIDGKFKEVEEVQHIPIIDSKTGQPIVDVKKVVDIRSITANDMKNIYYDVLNGTYRRRRRDKGMVYYEVKPYKPASAHQVVKVFKSMFEYAKDIKRYISVNPMADIKPAPYKNARTFRVSKEKSKALYHALMTYYDIKFRGIFMFLLEGRRKNEVLSLTWDDIDFDMKTYYVRYYFNKNKHEYEYSLPEHLHEVLSKLYEHYSNHFNNDNEYVFKSSRTGGKIDNFDKRWNAILKSVGIENVTRHDIRHWIGNVAINMGKTTAEVAYILGHADERTARRYSNVRKDTAGRVVSDVQSQMAE